MDIPSAAFAVAQTCATFSLAPFDTVLQHLINETPAERGKNCWQRGTRLIPGLLIWLVLILTLRRDLNYDQALNWIAELDSGGISLVGGCPTRTSRASQRRGHQDTRV